MNPEDVEEMLQDFGWTDTRTVNGRNGVTLQVQDMTEPPGGDFWQMWRQHKPEMVAAGISVSKDDETGEYGVTWWHQPGARIATAATVLPKMARVQGTLDDDGAGTLEPEIYDILKPHQRRAAATLFAVYQAGFNFALDAGEMGIGKTYISLATIRTLGLNFGVVCPANLVSKWTDTAIDVFNIEPEFVLSYDKARSGREDTFISRHVLAKDKGSTFTWNCFEPVILLFDEVHNCAKPDSLNAAMLKAAVTNPHIFTLGLSGTAANDPVEMRVLGQALGCHDGLGWWRWAKANGCYENNFGGLQFTTNQQRATIFLSAIHAGIFPTRGCRVLKSDIKGDTPTPAHDVFTSSVDAPDTYPKWLAPYVEAAEQAKEDDGDESLPITQQLRARMLDELALVPHAISQANEGLD